MRPAEINLQDPLQGRRWLQLLQPDAGCGFRLQPGLDLQARRLGFSLNSNAHGLRGPADGGAPNVVLGTSFAMGIAVHNEENWWALALPPRGWLNLGLAVGIREWGDLLSRFYRGGHERVWFLYHPNLWAHCRMYERWRESGTDVFRALRWRRDLASCIYLKLRRILRRPQLIRTGRLLHHRTGGGTMEIDTEYVHLDFDGAGTLFQRNLDLLSGILSRFREVHMVRLQIKQELVPEGASNENLRRTCSSYDRWYEATCSGLASLPGLRVHPAPLMTLDDFHPRDSHWNAAGNRRFAAWLQSWIP
ncbi:MAG: hypothetical protein KF791_05955 [Verrucomicrobiae bacterium]|nr:hypothetical protein [Verrucomicrobiae bacterium]